METSDVRYKMGRRNLESFKTGPLMRCVEIDVISKSQQAQRCRAKVTTVCEPDGFIAEIRREELTTLNFKFWDKSRMKA
jgi:hypothetical protein